MSSIRVRFDHGLGDCVHFAHLLQLYRRRGFGIGVRGEANKRLVWLTAGVDAEPRGDAPYHPWTYPAEFHDLDAPDWLGNKVAHGIGHTPLPELDEPKESLWRELCEVRLRCRDLISKSAHAAAARFLADLPPPYVLLHTHGTTWCEQKNIPPQVCLDLIRALLEACPGSVVVLDWDHRAPMIGHERVRGIKPTWGHISVEELAALYERAHLFLGIDSGPFHFAGLTDLPALGVFRYIPAPRCCLPNPNAVYMVPARDHRHWLVRQREWNLAEYIDDEPNAAEMVVQAMDILAGRRPAGQLVSAEVYGSTAGRYFYRRVGYDGRPMELLPDGTIGEGAAGCERTWAMREIDGRPRLTLLGKQVTCHLDRGDDGVWRGAWLNYEKMPIELLPLEGTPEALGTDGRFQKYAGFWIRSGSLGEQDKEVVNDVYLRDCYRTKLRGTNGQRECVVDIGAHIGAFARVWHEKNPDARIICVEACPENIECLRRNVDGFATVLHAACTYEAGPLGLWNSVNESGGRATGSSIVMTRTAMEASAPDAHYWRDQRDLPQVTLEDVMRLLGTQHIDVLKLDCEGSEYSILGGTPSLSRIYFICGEYHGQEQWDRFRPQCLPEWEYQQLFASGGLGIFHCLNPGFEP